MTDMPEARQRLASAMERRRNELDLLWSDVAKAGDLSLKTLYSVRTDPAAPLTARTSQRIDRGLRWEPGSVEKILGGEDPVPSGTSHMTLVPDLPPAPGDALDSLAAELIDAEADENVKDALRALWATRNPPEEKLRMIQMVRNWVRGIRPGDEGGQRNAGPASLTLFLRRNNDPAKPRDLV